MRRWFIELIAVCVAAAFAVLTIRAVSANENVAFFVALIGSIAVWEAVRFVMVRYSNRVSS